MKKDSEIPIVVLDTNVFLVSLAPQSQYAIIFDALLEGKFQLVISTEILNEYEEIIGKRYDFQAVKDIFELFLSLPNIIRQEVYYKWNIIEIDKDDNKFIDIAIASNAHFIVSNDKHFKILEQVDFPKLNCIKAEEFIEFLNN